MNLSNKLGLIGAPLALAFAVSTGAPAFAHHTDGIAPTPDAFSCKRTDLAGLTVQKLVKKLQPTVVIVSNIGKNPGSGPNGEGPGSAGSGVVIDSDKGYIVTNNHVVYGAKKLTVTVYDGASRTKRGEEFDVELVGTDPATDIAVLKLDSKAPKLPCAPLGDSSEVEVGDKTIAMGGPLGLAGTTTFGHVSAVGRGSLERDSIPAKDFIQTDAGISPGNSGGPLFKMPEGKGSEKISASVIGINTMIFSKTGGNEGLGFAVESNIVRDTANKLIVHGKVTHGILGIGVKELSKEEAKKLGMDKPHGVLVFGAKSPDGKYTSGVRPGSAAEKAGIKDGDVILNFGGHPLKDPEDLRVLVSRAPAGLKTDLTLLRDGKEMKIEVTLGDFADVMKEQPKQEQEQQEQQPEAAPPPEGPFGAPPQQPQGRAPSAPQGQAPDGGNGGSGPNFYFGPESKPQLHFHYNGPSGAAPQGPQGERQQPPAIAPAPQGPSSSAPQQQGPLPPDEQELLKKFFGAPQP